LRKKRFYGANLEIILNHYRGRVKIDSFGFAKCWLVFQAKTKCANFHGGFFTSRVKGAKAMRL